MVSNRVKIDNVQPHDVAPHSEQYEVTLHIDCGYGASRLYPCSCDGDDRPVKVDLFATNSKYAAILAVSAFHAVFADFAPEPQHFRHCGTTPTGNEVWYDLSDDGWDGFAIEVMHLP